MLRIRDILISLAILLLVSPILLLVSFLVWRQDRHSPFYIADRVGKDHKLFSMVKLRSMIINADSSGVDSTSSEDLRITPVGAFIRRYKLDELTQLWNVLWGSMSLVGPRPNVLRETELYSEEEKKLLKVRPGITDFSSIIFSDEGEILANETDPDLAYNQLIRPWKSRLGLIYIKQRSFVIDLKILFITALAIFNRDKAIHMTVNILKGLDCSEELLMVASRKGPLYKYPPPGFSEIVSSR
jgi:lipopolysaccharide/colanic/teichoic acid biosynthesis glycosyltransferase